MGRVGYDWVGPALSALSWLGAVAACTPSTVYTPTYGSNEAFPKSSPNEVEIVSTPPGRPYQEVGLLSAKEHPFASVADGQADLVASLREEGARRGCDAVWLRQKTADVQGSFHTTGYGRGVAFTSGSVQTLEGYEASCLVYTGNSRFTLDDAGAGQKIRTKKSRSAAPMPTTVSTFRFGMSPDEGRSACESEGNAWAASEGRTTCAGDEMKMFDMGVRFAVDFCDESLCGADCEILRPQEVGEMAAFRHVVKELEAELGPPSKVHEETAAKCYLVTSTYDCLSRKGARVDATWRFKDGFIKVALAPNEETKVADLHVVHRRTKKMQSTKEDAPPESVATAESPSKAACTPGQSVACAGPKRCDGYQVCVDDGSRFGACVCD